MTTRVLPGRDCVDARGAHPISGRRRIAGTVLRYIHDHYATALPLERLAAITGRSSWYVARTFRQLIGVPPHTYLMQVRLAKAQDLLALGWAPARVAHETGFSDQSHLNRRFKQSCGVTPGQHVREQRAHGAQDVESKG